jgi:hypothetical protein
MEAIHYLEPTKNRHPHKEITGCRQTCHLIENFGHDKKYTISGGPVNIVDEDGVAFKYIFTKK